MAGNVWQWTGDVYEGMHYRFLRGGSKDTYAMDLRVWARNNAHAYLLQPRGGLPVCKMTIRAFGLREAPVKAWIAKVRQYWPLIKSLQTGLLVSTGLAGYMSARCPIFHLPTLAGLFVSLAASISGSTILNMWWDRDIDADMRRTQKRPLASGKIDPDEALRVGLALSIFGVGWLWPWTPSTA